MIGLIDYGAGNLKSVVQAFVYLGEDIRVMDTPGDFNKVRKLILPGVGSFGPAMTNIQKGGWLEPVLEWLRSGRPFLGICLGMQLLFEASRESPQARGFSVFPGHCRRFQAAKVPQTGWNNVTFKQNNPVFTGIADGEYFYFIHGYYVAACRPDMVLATADYNLEYPAAVSRGRVYGVQFHPEKSGRAGLKLLDNWRRLC